MLERQLILAKINSSIEDLLENLYEVFDKLQITNNSEYEEMQDMVNIKRRFARALDSVLSVYRDIVKLKYLELQKRRTVIDIPKTDIIEKFYDLMKTLD